MSQTAPFLFDPRAFWGDENVKMMSGDEVAVYMRLLSHQWEEGSIPRDPKRLAAICSDGARHYAAEQFEDPGKPGLSQAVASLWPALKPCFIFSGENGSRLVNPRMKIERDRWVEKHKAFTDGGRKGGESKAKSFRSKASKSAKPGSSQAKARLKPGYSQPQASLKPGSPISVSGSGSFSGSLSGSVSDPEDRKNAGECAERSADRLDAAPPVLTFEVKGTNGHRTWGLTEPHLTRLLDTYQCERAKLVAELRKAALWCADNPSKRKTAQGMPRFLASWLNRWNDKGGASTGGPSESAYRATSPDGGYGFRSRARSTPALQAGMTEETMEQMRQHDRETFGEE